MAHANRDNFVQLPSWDGRVDTFLDFFDECLWVEAGNKWQDRVFLAPRIAARLTGRAKNAILRVKPGELQRSDGVAVLLRFLKMKLANLPVPNAGSRLEAFSIR